MQNILMIVHAPPYGSERVLSALRVALALAGKDSDKPQLNVFLMSDATVLALPNQRYYLVLLAPVVWLLVWTPERLAAPGARWPAWTAAADKVLVFEKGRLVEQGDYASLRDRADSRFGAMVAAQTL